MSALLLHVHNKLLIPYTDLFWWIIFTIHIGVVITIRDAKNWYQTLGIGLLIALVSYCLSLDFNAGFLLESAWIPRVLYGDLGHVRPLETNPLQ